MTNQYWFRTAFKFPWIFIHQTPRSTLCCLLADEKADETVHQTRISSSEMLPPPCQGQTTPAGHINQPPGESSLWRDSCQKTFSWACAIGIFHRKLTEGEPPALPMPRHPPRAQTPSSQALLIDFRLHHILESITSQKRKPNSHRHQFYLSLGFGLGWGVVGFSSGPGLGPIGITVKFRSRKK